MTERVARVTPDRLASVSVLLGLAWLLQILDGITAVQMMHTSGIASELNPVIQTVFVHSGIAGVAAIKAAVAGPLGVEEVELVEMPAEDRLHRSRLFARRIEMAVENDPYVLGQLTLACVALIVGPKPPRELDDGVQRRAANRGERQECRLRTVLFASVL